VFALLGVGRMKGGKGKLCLEAVLSVSTKKKLLRGISLPSLLAAGRPDEFVKLFPKM
jgi:hypothetical protein